jgi:hypothetical protein
MAKRKAPGQTPASAAFTFPIGLDERFRSPSDDPDNHVAPYERAMVYAAGHPDTHLASLWLRALDIGFMAGRYLAMEATQKEGQRIGFEKGKADGLSEGKRLGFVAGREFAEKQAAKLGKIPASDRILVDVGTDSPVAELSPPPPSSFMPVHASTQTDPPPSAIAPSTTPSPPFRWGDESYAFNPVPVPMSVSSSLSPPAPRDFFALRSNSTPFSTLQRRTHRRQKSARAHRCSASHHTSSERRSAAARVHHGTNTSFTSKRAAHSTLDWDRDPRLSDLSRVLRSMGWAREGGEVV